MKESQADQNEELRIQIGLPWPLANSRTVLTKLVDQQGGEEAEALSMVQVVEGNKGGTCTVPRPHAMS